MRLSVCILFILFFTFCRHTDGNKEMNVYFEKEIQDRIETLHQLTKGNNNMQINVHAIDKQINNLILLSKDVENLSASANKANSYFSEVSIKYQINSSGFAKINTGMHVNKIASVLKQNELNLLNQLIFKINPSQYIPLKAQ